MASWLRRVSMFGLWCALLVAVAACSTNVDERVGKVSSALLMNGQSCTFPAECMSGFCTDGVCCNSENCGIGGTCAPTGTCTCTPGNFQNGAMCMPCSSTNCLPSEYYNAASCGGMSNGCSACTTCSGGQYAQTACTSTSNTVCAPCSTCPGGQYASLACSPTTDTTCSTCTTCGAGQYASTACGGATNTVCSPCSTCPGGQYASAACTGTADTTCSACSTCGAGQYASTACTSSSNTVCSSCTAIAHCTSVTCTTSSNSTCSVCAAGYTGSTCQYSDAVTCNGHGTAQSNGTCNCFAGYSGASCNTCNAGYFSSGGSCIACSSGACGAGQYYSAAACTGAANGCLSCSTCGGGQYASSACTSTSNTVCSSCSTCTAGQYASSACTSSSNTVCSSCSTCAAGQYASSACTSSSNTVCSSCTAITHCTSLTCTTSSNSTCSVCAAGYTGSTCQYSDAVTCNGHGTAQSNGTCNCAAGYTGASCNACNAGYFSSGGSCIACSSGACGAGQYYSAAACTGMADGCLSCSTCGAGQYASTACSSTTNTVCSSCSTCAAGHYQSSACTPTSNTVCATCSTCPAGQWASTACTSTTDTVCSTCSTCAAGQYASTACTATTNTACSACTAISHCASPTCTTSSNSTCSACDPGYAGTTCQYSDAVTCNGHGTAQPTGACVCAAGYTGPSCNSCAAGSYSSGGSCIPCSSSSCGAGQYYNAAACTGTANGCTACSVCTAGQYASTACTSTTNTVCSACSTCPGGKFASTACTPTSDTLCSTCSTCPVGKYASSACTPTADTTCSSCSPIPNCAALTCTTSLNSTCTACNPGYAGNTCQYSDAVTCNGHGTAQPTGACVCSGGYTGPTCNSCAAGSYSSGGSCVPCSASSCGAGQYYNAAACSGTASGCTACSVCSAGQYASTACTSTANTVCSACSTCPGGKFASTACTPTSNTVCSTCSTCGAGQYASSACASTADTTCTSCSPIAHCTALTCTTASNSTCSACSPGYAGTTCQYSDAVTCNGHGTAQPTGACVCSGGYTGPTCSSCAAGNYSSGGSCVPCSASSCGAGQYFVSAACGGTASGCTACSTCPAGQHATSACTSTADTVCGACSTCLAGQYASSACTPTSDTVCTNCGAIAGCAVQPTCTNATDSTCPSCNLGLAGSRCQYSDAITCNGHGTAKSDGSCTCDSAYSGPGCAACAVDHYGYPACVSCVASACPAPSACQQAATCDAAGKCAYAPKASGIVCAAASCTGASASSASTCNGVDPTCPAPTTTTPCAPFKCDAAGASCATTCTVDGDCATGAHCIGGVCTGKVANGTACTVPAQCASGFCVDGVCCESACGGTCMACASAQTGLADGTCGNAKDGTKDSACPAATCASDTLTTNVCDGKGGCRASSTACAPATCDPGGTSCRTKCTSDGDCASYAYCASSTCKGKRADGASCTNNPECLSGNCVDNICCDTPCKGNCQACTAAKKGVGVDGNCGPVADGTDPDHVCTGATCAAGVAESGHVCDGKGACRPLASASCSPFACDAAGSACLATCTAATDCAAGFQCVSGACVKGVALGLACTTAAECDSKLCVDGVCCDSACNGACEACSIAARGGVGVDGTCARSVVGLCAYTDGDAGVADASVDDGGTPSTTSKFEHCTKPSDCASGFCVDGVCCDSACTDKCYSCSLATSPGRCVPEPAGVDLRSECAPSHACLGTCDGKGGCISAGPGTRCAEARCVSATTGIGAVTCERAGAECSTESAVTFDCAPYVCDPTIRNCLGQCESSNDCANGFVCNVDSHACVTASAPDTGSDGSCTMGRNSRGGSHAALVALGVLAGFFVSRRRARAVALACAATGAACARDHARETRPMEASMLADRASLAPSFTADGVTLRRGACVLRVAAIAGKSTKSSAPKREGERVVYVREEGIEEWYRSDPRGLEQGFTLARAPSSGSHVKIEIAIDGGLRPRVANGVVELVDGRGARVLAMGALFAKDSNGVSLPASLSVEGERVIVAVDTRDASFPVVIDPLVWALQAELAASGGTMGDLRGDSAAVDADTAALGAPGSGSGMGSVLVFTRASAAWSKSATVQASDGAAGDAFGSAVALRGDTLAIGAKSAAGKGAAYVFVRSAGAWTLQAKLSSSDLATGDELGDAIALTGDTLVVGAQAKTSGRGAAYVFVRTGTTWTQQAKLVASDGAASDAFGSSVAIDGTTIAVGASGKASARGGAYLFVQSGSTWSEQAGVVAADGAAGDALGASVAISGDTLIAGAPQKTVAGAAAHGEAYAFVRSGVSWTQQSAMLVTGAPNDRFGAAVSVAFDVAVIGAPGEGAAHVWSRAGSTWSQTQLLLAADSTAGDLLGSALAATTDTIVVGAPGAGSGLGGGWAFAVGSSNGSSCTSDGDCASRSCVDGVCCDTPCDGVCVACSAAKKGSGPDGNCSAVGVGLDPYKKCPGSVCKDGMLESAHACDGTGHCVATSTSSCAPFGCASASACATSCATDTDCASGFYCAAGTCAPAQKLGLPCESARACTSGFCASGVCCDRACDGACERCSVAEKTFGYDGTCAPINSGTCADAGPPPSDAAVATDVGGSVSEAGAPVVSGEYQRCGKSSECKSGFCVDGVCCDSACDQPCHSCALASSPGVCALEPAGVDLRAECGPALGCLGTCDGKGACTGAVAGALCQPTQCSSVSTGKLDVHCEAPGVACPIKSATPFDCAPYVCEPAFGRCRSDCKESGDCANGFVCDLATRTCTTAQPAEPEESGGCSTSRAPRRADFLFAGLALLTLGAWRRRTR